jgi:histidinol dehydrogenase
MLNIRRLSANAAGFREELNTLLAWETVSNESVNDVVKEVVNKVRTDGDAAGVIPKPTAPCWGNR